MTMLDHVDPDLVAGLQAIAAQRQLVALSLGAGVQSTTLALMAKEKELTPMPDVAIFADTGWEPAAVYEHLERLTAAVPFPVLRIQQGNLLADLQDPDGRFASIPYYTQREAGPCTRCDQDGMVDDGTRKCPRCRGSRWDDGRGIGRRQCTKEYKLAPIGRALRQLLGAKPPRYRSVPRGRSAVQWVGFSTDEVSRANRRKDSHGVGYLDVRYPLLEDGVNMSRTDCQRWLAARGWTAQKSACIGCPFHGNRQWRELRDIRPAEWQQAVELDHAIRRGGAGGSGAQLDGQAFLHRARVPLELAPIDHVTSVEWHERQLSLLDAAADAEAGVDLEDGRYEACSPYGCDDGEEVTA